MLQLLFRPVVNCCERVSIYPAIVGRLPSLITMQPCHPLRHRQRNSLAPQRAPHNTVLVVASSLQLSRVDRLLPVSVLPQPRSDLLPCSPQATS